MQDFQNSFISKQFLRSHWDQDYRAFIGSPEDAALSERLARWGARADLRERAAQAAFLEEFFRDTWGYVQSGQPGGEAAFTLHPDFPISGATARGGRGFADAALGYFP